MEIAKKNDNKILSLIWQNILLLTGLSATHRSLLSYVFD